MSQANVRSLDAIKDFRLALINYTEEARNALSGVDMEVRHFRNWLERDQLSYWKGQIKKCQETVQEAKADLHRRQLSQMNSDSVSDADQKEALRVAKRKLKEAEDKVEKIKKLIPVFEHAIAEYHSQSQPLGDRLAGGAVASIMLLERMIVAVERYMALQAPTTPVAVPTESASSAGGSAGQGKAASAAAGSPDEAGTPAAAATTAASTTPAEPEDGTGVNAGQPQPATAPAN